MSGRPCELRKLQALWDPRTPIPQHQNTLPKIAAALQPYADAAQAGDAAIERAKQFATLRARAAMAGVELYATEELLGGMLYLGVKWAQRYLFRSLPEVAAWLDRIDGGRP
ncbi:MAG: hypothetical protein K9J82_01175 [Methylotenera sp.]|nr:hypothetical protein [Methylotenera sp.]